MSEQKELLRKYNVPGPRYTSYPTVPYWEGEEFTLDGWKAQVKATFGRTNASEGISLYLHLPYCESLCTYCACNTRISVNHEVEGPYVDALLAEWKLYTDLFEEKPVLREIHLGGGTPTFFSPKNLRRLLEGLLENAELHPDHEYSFEGHPNNTTREHLQTFYDLGFRRVSFGIQDFEASVQQIINRVQPYENVVRVVKDAREIGFESVNFDLVYGLPLQKKSTVFDTIGKVLELRPDRIAFYGYAHVPWVKPGQRRYTEKDLPEGKEKQRLYELGRQLFLEAGYQDIGMDHFALPADRLYTSWKAGELHRNFMGYTPVHTELLLGLGASAIGDAWTGFAQNLKKVEEYREAVMAGEWPIFRGHLHNEEDLLLRRHILNLMCRYQTEWEEEQGINLSVAVGLNRMKELEADGLIIREGECLLVTEAGRPFVRNVCMALDARLARKKPDTELFSRTV